MFVGIDFDCGKEGKNCAKIFRVIVRLWNRWHILEEVYLVTDDFVIILID